MSDPKHRLLKPLKHPEFTVPGMLCIMIGAGFAWSSWLFGRGGATETPLIAGMLVLCGITLLFKSLLGTVLMVQMMILGLYAASVRIEFSWSNLPRLLGSLIFLVSTVCWLVGQIEFHRARGRFSRSSSAGKFRN